MFSTTDLVYLSFYFIYSLFCLFTGCMCEASAWSYAHKIEVHVLLHFLLLCLSKIDIWAVTNTQAQHKKSLKLLFCARNHLTHKQSLHILRLLHYREPTLRRVCWAAVTNCAPVTSLMTQTRFAVGFARWHSADRKLQVANRFKPQVDIQFVTDPGLIFENIRPGRGRGLILGTADDFSNLNVLLQNLRCWKKKLFSFPTQQILARSVKKRRSYRSSKSSGLQTNLSPSLREKIRFDGTSGLIFHPDNGSFAYTLACHTYHWRMHGGAKIRRFASFRLAVRTSTGPLFWFVWTEHERTHALKDHDWNDFVKLLQWANFHGIRCSCCPSASALRVEWWSTSVSWCLVRRPTDLLAQR